MRCSWIEGCRPGASARVVVVAPVDERTAGRVPLGPGLCGYAQDSSALEKRSAGRVQPSVLRGRWLTSTSTCSSADAVKAVRSMPLGK